MTTGKWVEPGVPHRGWSCVYVEDLGEPDRTCEMCEFAEIRYVHYMTHPDYPDELGCGCICAEHMEGDYVGPKRREARLRNRSQRKRKWLTRRWRTSHKGNAYLNVRGCNVVVFPHDGGWGYRVAQALTGRTLSRFEYDSEVRAKLQAFDAMTWLIEEEC
jgi:hypothetical protein